MCCIFYLAPTIQKKCSCGGSCSRCKGEEEADKVSMSIMKMESPAISHKPYAISYMPSAINQRDEQAQISEIMASKGSGHSLDDNSRSFMEQRFGYDFNHVRIHTDSYAARKSNELNAEAFIIGKDIFFNTGRHNPSSSDGKKLLAHELTHVVQQSQQNGNAFFRFKKDSEKYINKIDVNLSSTTDVPWLVWQIGGEKLKEKFSGLKERDDFKYSEGDATASYNDGTQETFDVSGGAIKCCGTPAGSNFSIHRKEGKDYVSGKGDPMPHASYFHKGYAFHGCGQVYGISPDWYCLSYPSHGCIHVKNSKMEQLNPFIKIRKTKVKINV
ncbi:MAG: hypothetical protein HW382_1149 [Deltaproteobacteria bacterium]|nr:hypothetical protein [Deltaproteobacteria bacterium]